MIDGSAQKVAIGVASAAAAAVGGQTYAVMLTASVACHIRISQAGKAATANDYLLKATDISLVLGCAPGDIVTVIQDTGAGSLYLVELTA